MVDDPRPARPRGRVRRHRDRRPGVGDRRRRLGPVDRGEPHRHGQHGARRVRGDAPPRPRAPRRGRVALRAAADAAARAVRDQQGRRRLVDDEPATRGRASRHRRDRGVPRTGRHRPARRHRTGRGGPTVNARRYLTSAGGPAIAPAAVADALVAGVRRNRAVVCPKRARAPALRGALLPRRDRARAHALHAPRARACACDGATAASWVCSTARTSSGISIEPVVPGFDRDIRDHRLTRRPAVDRRPVAHIERLRADAAPARPRSSTHSSKRAGPDHSSTAFTSITSNSWIQ